MHLQESREIKKKRKNRNVTASLCGRIDNEVDEGVLGGLTQATLAGAGLPKGFGRRKIYVLFLPT